MIRPLQWVGRNARVLIALAPLAALFLTDLSAFLRPALPYLVAAVYVTAMVRIDISSATRAAIAPRRIGGNLAAIFVFMALMPAAALYTAQAAGWSVATQTILVTALVPPPFASAAAICFLLGAEAALALEITILAALIAPFSGPFIAEVLLGEALPIDSITLSLRIAAMIAGGALVALVLRSLITPARISRNASALDGISACLMIVLIFPIFDGVVDTLRTAPWQTIASVLALVLLVNLGVQLVTLFALAPFFGVATAAALGISFGNRNMALYLAALPQNAFFSLFVALYQVPMYLTPLIMRRAMALITPRGT